MNQKEIAKLHREVLKPTKTSPAAAPEETSAVGAASPSYTPITQRRVSLATDRPKEKGSLAKPLAIGGGLLLVWLLSRKK